MSFAKLTKRFTTKRQAAQSRFRNPNSAWPLPRPEANPPSVPGPYYAADANDDDRVAKMLERMYSNVA